MLVEEDACEEFLDDPIKLIYDEQIDIRWYSDDVITIDDDDEDEVCSTFDAKCKVYQVQFDQYISSYVKKVSILPKSFSKIQRNIELLNQCRPLKISIVDCNKFSWFYRNNLEHKSDNDIEEQDIIVIDDILNCYADQNNCNNCFDENDNFVPTSIQNIQVTEQHKNEQNNEKNKSVFKKNKGLVGVRISTDSNIDKISLRGKESLSFIENEKFDLYANMIEKAFVEINHAKNNSLSQNIQDNSRKQNNDTHEDLCKMNSSQKSPLKSPNNKACNKGEQNKEKGSEEGHLISTENGLNKNENIFNNNNKPTLQKEASFINNSNFLKKNCNLHGPCTKQFQWKWNGSNRSGVIPHFHNISTSKSSMIPSDVLNYNMCRNNTIPDASNQNTTNTNKSRSFVTPLKSVTNYKKLFNPNLGRSDSLQKFVEFNNNYCANSRVAIEDFNFIPPNPYSTFLNPSNLYRLDRPLTQVHTNIPTNTLTTQNNPLTSDSSFSYEKVVCHNAQQQKGQDSLNYNTSTNELTLGNNYDVTSAVTHNFQKHSYFYNKFLPTNMIPTGKYPFIKEMLNTPATFPADTLNKKSKTGTMTKQSVPEVNPNNTSPLVSTSSCTTLNFKQSPLATTMRNPILQTQIISTSAPVHNTTNMPPYYTSQSTYVIPTKNYKSPVMPVLPYKQFLTTPASSNTSNTCKSSSTNAIFNLNPISSSECTKVHPSNTVLQTAHLQTVDFQRPPQNDRFMSSQHMPINTPIFRESSRYNHHIIPAPIPNILTPTSDLLTNVHQYSNANSTTGDQVQTAHKLSMIPSDLNGQSPHICTTISTIHQNESRQTSFSHKTPILPMIATPHSAFVTTYGESTQDPRISFAPCEQFRSSSMIPHTTNNQPVNVYASTTISLTSCRQNMTNKTFSPLTQYSETVKSYTVPPLTSTFTNGQFLHRHMPLVSTAAGEPSQISTCAPCYFSSCQTSKGHISAMNTTAQVLSTKINNMNNTISQDTFRSSMISQKATFIPSANSGQSSNTISPLNSAQLTPDPPTFISANKSSQNISSHVLASDRFMCAGLRKVRRPSKLPMATLIQSSKVYTKDILPQASSGVTMNTHKAPNLSLPQSSSPIYGTTPLPSTCELPKRSPVSCIPIASCEPSRRLSSNILSCAPCTPSAKNPSSRNENETLKEQAVIDPTCPKLPVTTSRLEAVKTFTPVSSSLSKLPKSADLPTSSPQTKEFLTPKTQKVTTNLNSATGYSPPILPISSYQETVKILELINSFDTHIAETMSREDRNISLKRKPSDDIEKPVKRITLEEYKKRPPDVNLDNV